MIERLPGAWLSRGLLPRLLWPLSGLYRAMAGTQTWLYRHGWLAIERLPVPVIVVGNVVAGGAGKTPLVMALVKHLQDRGWRPGVISRGYGRSSTACLSVQANGSAADCGDEPLLIRQTTGAPVFVAASRVDAARALLQAHPEVDLIVADDGLQHHRLGRDVNIAVFDERGLGNGWLLPAGPLREPWPRTSRGDTDPVRPIDLIVQSADSPGLGGFVCQRRLAKRTRAADGSTVALSDLQGQRLHALAGIAKPSQFFDMLRQAGLTLERTTGFADHHAFSAADLPQDPEVTVLVTEKDAVKLMPLAESLPQGPRLLAVPLELEPDQGLLRELESRLNAQKRAAHPIP
jgi:tetraacyldisaccharide 4'-kinase